MRGRISEDLPDDRLPNDEEIKPRLHNIIRFVLVSSIKDSTQGNVTMTQVSLIM